MVLRPFLPHPEVILVQFSLIYWKAGCPITKISTGTVNEAPIYPREIVKTALDYNANSVILAHNHPGGSNEASKADIEATQKVIQALNTISVRVIDHIIVADNKYLSLAEKGLLNI